MRPSTARWTAVLLLLLMWSISASLTGIAQGLEGTGSLLIISLAIALGWALAWSGQSGAQVGGLAGFIGLGLISFRIGRLGEELLELASSIGDLIVGVLLANSSLSATPTLKAFGALLASYQVLITRFWAWLGALIAGRPTVDPIASALAWSALLWSAAFWAAWWTWRRERPLIAVLPAFGLLGSALYISRSGHVYFLLPLGASLLLMALAAHESRERRWTAARVARSESMLSPLALSAVPVTVLLVTVAALTPSLSARRLLEFGRAVSGRPAVVEGGLRESLGLSRASSPGTGFDPVLFAGLPNRHLIGSGSELSERIVMTVTLTNPRFEAPNPRYHWRALTYDRYSGRGWQTSSLAIQSIDAGDSVPPEISSTDQVLRQRVQAVGELGGLAYSAGRLAAIDQEFELAWREVGRDPFAATLAAEAYWAESLLPQVSQAELRAAGTDYPDWILERYVDLPPEVPARVLTLARDLTATAPTPFDRAIALERYLRAFPYTLDVPAPPTDRDIVDYFLFDLQRGYCDYYASSMVVLARAAGLPARLVVGYFTGAAQPTEGTVRYVVTEAEAHSWVELYFPGIGWVEFEPTGGRPAIERPEAEPAGADVEPPELSLGEQLRTQRWAALWGGAIQIAGVAVLAALVGGLGWLVVERARLRRLPPAQAVSALYRRFFAAFEPSILPGATPHELLEAYAARSAAGDWPASRLRSGIADARRLIDLQVAAAFGPRPAEEHDRAQALRAWQRLRPRLWLARLLGR